jgi:hypothetical protein
MSLKAIIILPLVDRRTPPVGKFSRSEKYDNHIWEGREYDLSKPLDIKEFNASIGPALAYFPQREPHPKPVLIQEEEAAPPIAPSHLQVPFERIKKRRARFKPNFIPATA